MTDDDEPQDRHQALGDPARLIRDALLRELVREAEHDGRIATRLELVARALIDKGSGGDVAAIRETFDRVAGKALPGVPDAEAQPRMVTVGWSDRIS